MIEKNEEIANKCEAFARENFTEMIKKTKLYVPFDKILSRCSTGLNPRKNFVLDHGSCFPGCKETAVNSEDPAAHCLLNPVNRLCAQVKRMFAVHLRIHRNNVRLWLNEKAFQREKMGSMGFGRYLSFFYRRIFLSGKTIRRRDVFAL